MLTISSLAYVHAKHPVADIQHDEFLKDTMRVLGRMEYLKLLDVRGQLELDNVAPGWIDPRIEVEREHFQQRIRNLEARQYSDDVQVKLKKMQKLHMAWRSFVIQMFWHGVERSRPKRRTWRCMVQMAWKAMLLQMMSSKQTVLQ